MSQFPTVILSRSAAQRVGRGHPWIFRGMVEKYPSDLIDGDQVQVRDSKRRPLGVGFWNSQSKLVVRILSRQKTALDLEFFRKRIRESLRQRRMHFEEGKSFRLIHAEADGLSGLIVDLYSDVAVIQISSLGLELRKDMIVEALVAEVGGLKAIVERGDIQSRQLEGMKESGGVLFGEPGDVVHFKLNHLDWQISWEDGHKTGCYLDQQQNYLEVAKLCNGKRILDAFTFQGGFALHALSAGASHITALDQSKVALDLAARIQKVNKLPSQIDWVHTNVFDWLKENTSGSKSIGKFDVIILDPPSFARNRASLNQAFRGYKELHLRALKLLAPDGVLISFTCSHHVTSGMYEEVIIDSAFDCRTVLKRMAAYSQSLDHPILPGIPETEYLKGFAYQAVNL